MRFLYDKLGRMQHVSHVVQNANMESFQAFLNHSGVEKKRVIGMKGLSV